MPISHDDGDGVVVVCNDGWVTQTNKQVWPARTGSMVAVFMMVLTTRRMSLRVRTTCARTAYTNTVSTY